MFEWFQLFCLSSLCIHLNVLHVDKRYNDSCTINETLQFSHRDRRLTWMAKQLQLQSHLYDKLKALRHLKKWFSIQKRNNAFSSVTSELITINESTTYETSSMKLKQNQYFPFLHFYNEANSKDKSNISCHLTE